MFIFYGTFVTFSHIRAREHTCTKYIRQHITLYNRGLTGFLLSEGGQNKMQWIINLLFGVFVDDMC